MLEAQADASRAAVEHSLDRLAAMSLVQEVTAHQRFQFWKAAL